MSISIPWIQELEREDSGRLRKAWATGYDAGAARAGSARAEGYEDGLAQGQQAAYEEGRKRGYADGRADGWRVGYADGLNTAKVQTIHTIEQIQQTINPT